METVHGGGRLALLEPYLGEFQVRQVSVLTGSLLIVLTPTLGHGWLRAGYMAP